ncbi:CARDB domain-containing protein [Rubripirellula reticaptiva]|uniref:CARDB domain-containing protein n=1 Tax=Rubripirellula reticaptiva TaxID=2528013 RepID=A0A5C6ESG7_9BACT|nr:CARDB domain-containing protein [Rubripirellula reticaptiva]TWU51962.1 hypothetical protein Poly59_35590 [Rubripirellula reticaptiva]
MNTQRRPRRYNTKSLALEALEQRRLLAVGIWQGDLVSTVVTQHPSSRINLAEGTTRIHFTDVAAGNGAIDEAMQPGTVTDTDPNVRQPCTTGATGVTRTGTVTANNVTGHDEVFADEYGYVGQFSGRFNSAMTEITGTWSGDYGYEACDYYNPTTGQYEEQIDPLTNTTLIQYGQSSGTWISKGRFIGDVEVKSLIESSGLVTATVIVQETDLLRPVDVAAYWVDDSGQRISELLRWQVQTLGETETVLNALSAPYDRPYAAASILVVADDGDIHVESDEMNNEASLSVAPEIAATSLDLIASNQTVAINMVAFNLLIQDSVSVRLNWGDQTGGYLETAAIKQVNPIASDLVPIEFDYDELLLNRPAGAAQLSVKVDVNNDYKESNESNNFQKLNVTAFLGLNELQLDASGNGLEHRFTAVNFIHSETIRVDYQWRNANGDIVGTALTKDVPIEGNGEIDAFIFASELGTPRPTNAVSIAAVLDADNHYFEMDESDNQSSELPANVTASSLLLSDQADVATLTLQASNVFSNEIIDIELHWADEQGNLLAVADSATWSPTGNLASEITFQTAGFSENRPQTATHLIATADPQQRFAETDEDDNNTALDIRPSLNALSLTYDRDAGNFLLQYNTDGLLAGEELLIQLYWRNDSGSSRQTAFTRSVVPDNDSVNFERFQYSKIRYQRPSWAVELVAVLDSDSRFVEIEESDNTASADLPRRGDSAADLVGVLPNDGAPISGPSGDVVYLEWLIENAGGTQATASTHRVYWSSDAQLDATDIELDSFETTAIEPFESHSQVNARIVVPDGIADGPFFLLLDVDANNEVTESDEGNNLMAVRFDVTALSAWTNQSNPYDVNEDAQVTALDALNIINELSLRRFIDPTSGHVQFRITPAFSYDVNGDFQITALDALQVINRLGRTATESELQNGPGRKNHLLTTSLEASRADDLFHDEDELELLFEDTIGIRF